MPLDKAAGPAAEGTGPDVVQADDEVLAMLPGRRSPELETLLNVISRAQDGDGCPVLLVGAPGSGKTHLASSVCRWAQAQGVAVMWTSCEAASPAPALWPWLRFLREYLRSRPSGTFPADLERQMSEVIEMFPAVDQVLQGRAVPDTSDATASRFRLFDAVSQVIRRASEDDALLFVMDDLQAADASSLALLQHVGNELWGSRVVILAVSRPLSSRSPAALRAAHESLSRARGSYRFEVPAPEVRAHPRRSGGLSARETAVAALVVEGLSNRQIADKLFISERTAENHVQNILNKLGYSTRAQVAAWYERNSLA